MGTITIIGVGLTEEQLTLGAVEALRSGANVLLHTNRIGCADWLAREGIAYASLDELYEACEDFDLHAERAADAVIKAAEAGDLVYAVYDIRDRSVQKLLSRGIKCRVIAGVPVEGALAAFADGATRTLEASDWENYTLSACDNALIREIDSRELASEVKLKLMDCYPDETLVYLLQDGGRIAKLPLYDLDRMRAYDHRTCALVTAERDITKLERYTFDDLLRVTRRLRAPDGCPWDRAQTHETLCPCLVEESYEVIDAVDSDDMDHLYDELGDVLLQVAMHAEIAHRHGEFEIGDATTAVCKKMIGRHTHIFGTDEARRAEAVPELWMRNKMKENGQTTYTEVLRDIRKSLPALLRAKKLCDKADRVGVGCADAAALAADAASAVEELSVPRDTRDAIGRALFAICALSQRLGVDPEIALNAASDRFVERFDALERATNGFADGTERLWSKVKL